MCWSRAPLLHRGIGCSPGKFWKSRWLEVYSGAFYCIHNRFCWRRWYTSVEKLSKIVFKILASDVLPVRDLSLSGASNKSNEYMGAYNLSEKTGWGDHWIMVRIFQNQQINRPRWHLPFAIRFLIIVSTWWETENWKMKQANGNETSRRSVPNGKRGLPLEIVYNFRRDFLENCCSIWLSTKISEFSFC